MKALHRLVMGSLLAGAILCVSAVAQQPAVQESYQPSPYANHGSAKEAIPYKNFGDNQAEQYVLQSQSLELAQKYVKTEKEDDKKDLRKKLTQLLGEQFDLHLEGQQKELDELEKQVAKLKAVLKKRKDAKENIVERRLEQLVQEADGLGWNAPRGGHFGGDYRQLYQWASPKLGDGAKTPLKK
jgi:Spy/CpxP family protein refolding chaperone